MTDAPLTARAMALRRWAIHPPVARAVVCTRCGKDFVAKAEAKYCSQSCRQMAYQARQKITPAPD